MFLKNKKLIKMNSINNYLEEKDLNLQNQSIKVLSQNMTVN